MTGSISVSSGRAVGLPPAAFGAGPPAIGMGKFHWTAQLCPSERTGQERAYRSTGRHGLITYSPDRLELGVAGVEGGTAESQRGENGTAAHGSAGVSAFPQNRLWKG